MLKVMDIFKYLPAAAKKEDANCKKCGASTCMMFAMKVSKKEADISKCPKAPQELIDKINEAGRVQQETVTLDGLKIGGETVMYRHEKTFINPCPFFIKLDKSDDKLDDRLDEIAGFKIEIIGNEYKVDGVYMENPTEQDKQKIKEAGLILLSDLSDFKEVKETCLPDMVRELTYIREKAVIERDEAYSKPVFVHFKENDPLSLCAKVSAAVCKYVSMIIFDTFDKAVLTTLITLRLNIYTDPQKPLQVESKVYEINNPDEDAYVFLTTNFALSYFAVANELSSLKNGSYLVITPSEGMSVLTAWSAEKITAEIASKIVNANDILEKVKVKRLIIPGLLADLQEELQEALPEWEIVPGTIEAYRIPEFLKKLESGAKI